jgi:hypothetical protein
MVKRFVAELPRKQILCAGSELSPRVLRKVFAPTLFPITVAVCAERHSRETSNVCRPVPRLGHQLNPRVRNACPIVQILHCLGPISTC